MQGSQRSDARGTMFTARHSSNIHETNWNENSHPTGTSWKVRDLQRDDTDAKNREDTKELVGIVFGVFIGLVLLLLLVKWLSRVILQRDARLRFHWGSLIGMSHPPAPEVVRRGSTIFVPTRRGSQTSDASVEGELLRGLGGVRRGSADSHQTRHSYAGRQSEGGLGSRTPLFPTKSSELNFLPVECVYEPVVRQDLKAEYINHLIKKRRGQMMVLSNLARSLGKSQTAGVVSDLDNTFDFHSLARQLAGKANAFEETRTYAFDQRGPGGASDDAPGTGSEDHEYHAFSMLLLLTISFLLLGRNMNIMVGPEFSHSDQSINTVLIIVSLVLLIEFAYNVMHKKEYLRSFFFWVDLLVLLTTLPDVVLFFDSRAFDFWNDDGPRSQSSVRAGALAVGVRYFGDIVRVFKIYSLLNRSWTFLKLFSSRRESVVGRLVGIGIKQKVCAIAFGLLFVHTFLTILSRTYDQWPQQSWDDELRRMQMLLTLSGNVPMAEPFLSFATRWISHQNCEGGIHQGPLAAQDGKHVIELDSESDTHCYVNDACRWPEAQMASQEDTSGCRVRYLRVNGVDVWGQGPSGLGWMPDLRAFPSERTISFVEVLDDVAICPHVTLSAGRGVLAEAWEYGTVADKLDPIDGDPCTMLVLESRSIAEDRALKSVMTVLVLVVMLGTSNYIFHDLGRRLIVEPILEMVDLVQEFSVNPMAEVDEGNFVGASSDTKYIGRALFKLSNLLQVAYGEVGAYVIQHNLESERAINALVPGSRHNMIIGFCDIRSFTTCTEGLQDEVMVYVNKIADYIHVAVSDNDGHPNKNIGDAFQVAWQIPTRIGHLGKKKMQKYIGDSALRSFIRIIIETTACPKLIRLTCRDEVQARIPGYLTTMGFGLHAGWAIQGAVGSEHKIDLAWLSPHVQWAERLEFATKLYKVPILMSDAFREHLSPKVQRLCRRVDRVKVPDTPVPLDLYTYDVKHFDLEDFSWPPAALQSGNGFFAQFPPAYRSEWSDAFQAAVTWYVDGDWVRAAKLLRLCQAEVPDDGPTLRLLSFMQSVGGDNMVCPQAWKGYRETAEF